MKKQKKWLGIILSSVMAVSLFTGCSMSISGSKDPDTDKYALDMPDELSGLYEAEVDGDTITIYDKDAKANNLGGFCFSVSLYQNPSDYLPGNAIRKVGELRDADGVLYDVAVQEPSDVQYDLEDQAKADNYMKIYNFREKVGAEIVAINGSSYSQNEGMKGSQLYTDVMDKLVEAVNQGWDAEKYEAEGFSSMYAVVGGDDPMAHIGYIYQDINLDGIDELMIGEIAEGEWKGIVYDMFTMVDREPVHVVSGYDRDRYYVAGPSIANEYSSGAAESGTIFYSLESNSSELLPQVGFKYDGYTDESNPYYISYDVAGDVWESTTESEWNELKGNYGEYDRFDYTPLSEYGNEEDIDTLPAEVLEGSISIDGEEYDLSDEDTQAAIGIFALFALFGIGTMLIITVIWYVLQVIGYWKVFKKMDEPGWKSLIPFYNTYIMFKRTWSTGAFWVMIILTFLGNVMCTNADVNNLTVINIIGLIAGLIGGIVLIIQNWKLVRSFGRGIGYFILFVLFEPIMILVLGFGKDEYIGD